jgi:hypothetical protein
LSIEQENNNNNQINNNELALSLQHGDLSIIKKAKYGEINFKELINGQTILHIALDYSDITFLKYAFMLGARIDLCNINGNTLLEYACLSEDPNMINFLAQYGANMQKHLYFREGTIKYHNMNDSIDISILLKIILSYNNIELSVSNNIIFNKLNLIKNLINLNDKINVNDYTFNDLFNGLFNLLNKIPEVNALTYLDIINEELLNVLKNKLGCPPNKLEIILVNLVPFIEYPFTLSVDWLLSLEIKYIILNLLKKNNNLNIKKDLIEYIWKYYINTEIIQEDYLGCIISQWITKIKV